MSSQIFSDGSSNPSRRVPELDGIRGMAILLVLIWHYGVVISEPAPDSFLFYVQSILSLTWSGVDLFFVLSGFLIGGILIENKGASNYFKVFYARRICRILPLYFFSLFLFFLLIFIFPSLNTASPINWLFENSLPLWTYATFTQNITMAQFGSFGSSWLSVTWSLAVEEQFYLVLPVVIFSFSRRKLPFLLTCFILAAPLLRFALYFIHPRPRFAGYMLMPCRADALLLGVLCAYIIHNRQLAAKHLRILYGVFILLTLGVIGIISSIINTKLIGPFTLHPFVYTWLALLYACFLLIAITEKRGLFSAIARIRWLRNLGFISYGVYVYHIAALGLTHALFSGHEPQVNGWKDAFVTFIALLLTLAISHLSWKFFEKPIVAIGHSFKYKQTSKIELETVQRAVA